MKLSFILILAIACLKAAVIWKHKDLEPSEVCNGFPPGSSSPVRKGSFCFWFVDERKYEDDEEYAKVAMYSPPIPDSGDWWKTLLPIEEVLTSLRVTAGETPIFSFLDNTSIPIVVSPDKGEEQSWTSTIFSYLGASPKCILHDIYDFSVVSNPVLDPSSEQDAGEDSDPEFTFYNVEVCVDKSAKSLADLARSDGVYDIKDFRLELQYVPLNSVLLLLIGVCFMVQARAAVRNEAFMIGFGSISVYLVFAVIAGLMVAYKHRKPVAVLSTAALLSFWKIGLGFTVYLAWGSGIIILSTALYLWVTKKAQPTEVRTTILMEGIVFGAGAAMVFLTSLPLELWLSIVTTAAVDMFFGDIITFGGKRSGKRASNLLSMDEYDEQGHRCTQKAIDHLKNNPSMNKALRKRTSSGRGQLSRFMRDDVARGDVSEKEIVRWMKKYLPKLSSGQRTNWWGTFTERVDGEDSSSVSESDQSSEESPLEIVPTPSPRRRPVGARSPSRQERPKSTKRRPKSGYSRPQRSEPRDADWVENLSNDELRAELMKHGYNPGPCTAAVRSLLEKKLKEYMGI